MAIESDFDFAVQLHQDGKVREASEIYRQTLQSEPNHTDALHLLGVICHQMGNYAESIALIGRAISIDGDNPIYWSNYGLPLHSLGRNREALVAFNRALDIHPTFPQALANRGMVQKSLGQHDAALASFREALRLEPYHPDALIKSAQLLETMARESEAIAVYEDGIRYAPRLEFYVNLGALYVSTHRPEMALGPLQLAIKRVPDCLTAIINLGMAFSALGRDADALISFRNAFRLQPRSSEVLKRLLFHLLKLGKTDEALATIRQAEEALQLPSNGQCGDADAHFILANACNELFDASSAQKHFARAAELHPDKPLWQLRSQFCLLMVYENVGEIEHCFARIEQVIESVRPLPTIRSLDEIVDAKVFPGIDLSYHGRDQRQLKENTAALYEPFFSDRCSPKGSGLDDRKRIGMLVTQRHEGLFLRCLKGVLARLDTERFQLVIICPRSAANRVRKEIARTDLQFIILENALQQSITLIREAACDLIYYWEVGSDATNYFLPFARLAPIQCTGWGSTITTGVPAVDYFLSSSLVETSNSDSQYTEKLWRSKTLFCCEPRLPQVTDVPASHFGLPENRRLYLCFQNPLKIHPDADSLFAGILAADPKGLIVLSARQANVVKLLKDRFHRHIPDAERIVFLPAQSFDDYCRLLQLADVVLDTPHNGAGSSAYDLFSFNLPVVTLPGEFIVGRITQACYRKMGVTDLIVENPQAYIEKAVQVATDRDYRAFVVKRIAEASDVLFNDIEAVREYERFFEEAASQQFAS